jgi:hypothetical protein
MSTKVEGFRQSPMRLDVHTVVIDNISLNGNFHIAIIIILRCVIPVVCRKTNGEVNISNENIITIVWIYDGV